MGRKEREILGGAAVAASFIPGLGTVVGLSVGSLLRFGGYSMYASARKKGKAERQEGTCFSVASTTGGLPVVYGKAKFAVGLADVRVDEASDNDEDLWVVGSICHGGRRTGGSGGINNILKVWFDDRLAVDDGVVQSPFSGLLDYYEHLGTDLQDVDAAIAAVFPTEHPATSKGRQIAYIVMRLIYDRGKYPNDLPNVVVEVEGNQVYDPRDSTWKYSTNPALCIRDYLLSGVFGAKITAAKIVDSTFEAAANFCDELVTVPDGAGGSTTQKRFECNGALDPNNSAENNLDELKSSCRGEVIFQGGKYRLHIPQSETPETFELDESNIVGDVEYFSGGIDYAANVVRASFIDAGQEYRANQVQFPEPGAANAYLTADNNFESIRDLELPMTTDEYMAQQICQVVLNESRQDITCVVTAKEEALKLQVGSLVKTTLDTPGWSAKQFWVDGLFIGMDDKMRVVLREYDAAAYSYTTMSDKDTVPDTALPDPFTVAAPTGLTLLCDATTKITSGTGGDLYRIKVTWTRSVHTFLDYEEVFARKQGDGDWQPIKRVDARDTKLAFVPECSAGDTWEIGVRATNNLDVNSDMVTDTVEISAATEPPHVNDPPDAPGSVTLTANTSMLEYAGAEDSVQYRYLTRLSMSVVYTKDGLFQTFQFRVWNSGEDKEKAQIVDGEGYGGASPYILVTKRSDRTQQNDTWYCEVRVLNDDFQDSGWTQDSDVVTFDNLDRVDIEGARQGRVGLGPDGEPDPERDPDRVRQRRSRDLFSGDGAAGGHSGGSGSGDTPAVSAEDIEIGSEADYKRPLKDVVGVGSDGKPEITDPTGTRMVDLEDGVVKDVVIVGSDVDITAKNLRDRTVDLVPTNNPAAASIVSAQEDDGSCIHTIGWNYTQGAIPADGLLLLFNVGDSSGLSAPTVASFDYALPIAAANDTVEITGFKSTKFFYFGVVAYRDSIGGRQYGSVITSAAAPDWIDAQASTTIDLADMVVVGDDGDVTAKNLRDRTADNAPTNDPVASSIAAVQEVDGSGKVTVGWTYAQGAFPADGLLLIARIGDASGLAAPTVTDFDLSAEVAAANDTYEVTGYKATKFFYFGIVAYRDTAGGRQYGSVISSAAAPDWQDVQVSATVDIDGTVLIDGVLASEIKGRIDTAAPTNDAVPTDISLSQTRDGSGEITLTWTYAQGAVPADGLRLLLNVGDSSGLAAPTVSACDSLLLLDPAGGSVVVKGYPADKFFYFGIVAYRSDKSGISYGSVVSSASAPDWQDVQVSTVIEFDEDIEIRDRTLSDVSEGARRGEWGTGPNGEPDPEMDPDRVRQRRSRDLVSGEGGVAGQTGPAGSGDTPVIDAEDVEIGADKDTKLNLADEAFQKSVDDLDDIDDGTTHKKTDANERNGGGYAHTGLDGDGKVKLDVPLAYAAAEVPAIDTATGKVDEAILTKADKTLENTINSQSKADAAEAAAEATAAADATTKADAAQAAAEATASADATTKADAAQAAAEATASGDATTKADAAQAAAEATASADATTKANAAEAAANQETTDRGLAADGGFTGMVDDVDNLPAAVSGAWQQVSLIHTVVGGQLLTGKDEVSKGWAYITVANHQVQYRHGNKSYTGADVGKGAPGLAFSTLYYVYADDPGLAGGAVTYYATTSWQTVIASADYYVGMVTTPADGGGDSGGTPGGGGPPPTE